MKYVLDTNIVILMIKNRKFNTYFQQTYLTNNSNLFYLSFVSLGEVSSIAKQNKWGKNKMAAMNLIIQELHIVPLDNELYISSYATIDAYSQGKLTASPLPLGTTSRNMGKNDLWIAAITKVLDATLITTDKDFNHLAPHLIKIDYIDIMPFQ
ncbi:MAG: type II toxin-antitoxin system VapC family toxin [Bernardetiaceae bacterium]|nr:type II toxin-antitoxin system VapC family toxin [Bernardetiaceae bacterium]